VTTAHQQTAGRVGVAQPLRLRAVAQRQPVLDRDLDAHQHRAAQLVVQEACGHITDVLIMLFLKDTVNKLLLVWFQLFF